MYVALSHILVSGVDPHRCFYCMKRMASIAYHKKNFAYGLYTYLEELKMWLLVYPNFTKHMLLMKFLKFCFLLPLQIKNVI